MEGISCDLCHKIDGVGIDETGGRPGILSYRFRRPGQGRQLFYGPFDDVYPGDDSFHPLYPKSHYCAPCHHGKFWDVLIYSEFQEWLDSSYKDRNIHCQDCHMKPQGKMNRFALEEEGGLKRDPLSIPSHVNFGVSDEAFMKEAINLETAVDIQDNAIIVTVKIENTNAGHHYPTGNPMRNMILLVEVTDPQGETLQMIQGNRVPSWGGEGDHTKGNYAGLPGKGFAKVLKTRSSYTGRKQRRKFDFEYPAPHWRPVTIESDNRIPADGMDVSTYHFKRPNPSTESVEVNARLIFRRTYKKWLDSKKLKLNDMQIAGSYIVIKGKAHESNQ